MGKKNLDRLFQEKFKDFSEIPDKKVWENISASLDAKHKKRRIIPLWIKLGGVAAILAVAVYLIDPLDSEESDAIPKVTDIEKSEDSPRIKKSEGSETFEINPEEEKAITDVDSDTENARHNDTVKEKITLSENAKDNNEGEGTSVVGSEIQKSQVAQGDSDNTLTKNDGFDQSRADEVLKNRKETETIAVNSMDKNESTEKLNDDKNKKSDKLLEEGLTEINDKDVVQNSETAVEESKKKSILDEIEEQGNEEKIADEGLGNRWSVGGNIAPVYFNSIGDGSPIHSSFVSNSKSGEVNLSYGLSVAYALNKKLSIRTGINKVDYGYDTNDVEFSSSLSASNALQFSGGNGQFENIDYTTTSENLVVESMDGFNAPVKNAAPELASKSATRNGVMGQQFGYLEVPLELNYALLDKRFGVNLVGGFSSLFLVDNSVILSSGDLTTEVGEANNLNSVNFSGNIGFGINYKFTRKILLNVEPVFKYQLNTFSNTAGEFQPFSVGVYSGLHFRF
ncbi:outer membrane beta-barrel protein [Maribacter algicola]|uniref:Outer membrane beta-barrel protein n=1 Tax=Meishania litoralis TaxID=3434685 RepID=A0ACC7LH68_9FLAO